MKQLTAADQHDPLADQPKAGVQRADRKVQAAGFGETASCRKTSPSRSDLGLGLADDEHVLPKSGRVELVADLADVAAETLDAFDLQLAGGLHRSGGDRRGGDRGKAIDRAAAHRRCRASLADARRAGGSAAPPPVSSAGSMSRNQLPGGR